MTTFISIKEVAKLKGWDPSYLRKTLEKGMFNIKVFKFKASNNVFGSYNKPKFHCKILYNEINKIPSKS